MSELTETEALVRIANEAQRFEQWSVSDERANDLLDALKHPGSNVNNNRHALTGWLGRARIAERREAELVEALRELFYASNKGPDERNRIRKQASALLDKHGVQP